jgi:hypothetical protein
MVNAHPGNRQRRNFVSGDERAATGSNRAKLGHRFAVTGDNEGFARRYCFDHLRVLIAQLALRDSLSHRSIVARSATVSYTLAGVGYWVVEQRPERALNRLLAYLREAPTRHYHRVTQEAQAAPSVREGRRRTPIGCEPGTCQNTYSLINDASIT